MRQSGLTVPSKSVLPQASTIATSTNCTGGVKLVVSESRTQNSLESTEEKAREAARVDMRPYVEQA
jgi:hypothetical protein